jgi:hypothetical protein
MVSTALESQAQAVDEYLGRTLTNMAEQWTAVMAEKLQETAADVGRIHGSLEGLQELKVLVSGLVALRAAVDNIGLQGATASAAMQKMGDNLEAQDGKLAAVSRRFEEQVSGFLAEHLGKHTERLQDHFMQQSYDFQESLDKQDTRLVDVLRQQETQIAALAAQMETLQPALPTTKHQVTALQRNLRDIQQRISNMLYKVRNSGLRSSARQVQEELEAIHAETETISGQIADIVTPEGVEGVERAERRRRRQEGGGRKGDAGGGGASELMDIDGEQDGEARTDEARDGEARTDDDISRDKTDDDEEEEEGAQCDAAGDDKEPAATPEGRRVVVRSPSRNEGLTEPHYKCSQPLRSIMKVKAVERRAPVIDMRARIEEALGLKGPKDAKKTETTESLSQETTATTITTAARDGGGTGGGTRPKGQRQGLVEGLAGRTRTSSGDATTIESIEGDDTMAWFGMQTPRRAAAADPFLMSPAEALTQGFVEATPTAHAGSGRRRDDGPSPWFASQAKRRRESLLTREGTIGAPARVPSETRPNQAAPETGRNQAVPETRPNQAASGSRPNQAAPGSRPNQAAPGSRPNQAAPETKANWAASETRTGRAVPSTAETAANRTAPGLDRRSDGLPRRPVKAVRRTYSRREPRDR